MSDADARAVVIGNRHIPYKLVRSSSVTKLKLSMTMTEFCVTAPIDSCDSDIQRALTKKHKWIVESHASLQEKYERTHKIARFRTGAKLPYWGRLVQLRTYLTAVDSPSVQFKNGLHIEHPCYATATEHDDAIEAVVQQYLKQRFESEARYFVNKYSDALNVCAKTLRIVEMSKRWGSCTHAGTISLDWRLVYAPKRVAAYVVAHELAHLRISNHSQKFWNLLSSIYGLHQQEHEWLEKNEHMLGYQRLNLYLAC